MAITEVAQSTTTGKPTASVVGKPRKCGLVPRVGVLPPEGYDLGQGRGAIGVGIITSGGGFHGVTASPKIVKGIVDDYRAGSMLVGHFDTSLNGIAGDRLTDFEIGVPSLACIESGLLIST